MTFESWLKKQTRRGDAIGDLARDYKMAITIKPELRSIHASLAHWNGDKWAHLALDEAIEEYNALPKRSHSLSPSP